MNLFSPMLKYAYKQKQLQNIKITHGTIVSACVCMNTWCEVTIASEDEEESRYFLPTQPQHIKARLELLQRWIQDIHQWWDAKHATPFILWVHLTPQYGWCWWFVLVKCGRREKATNEFKPPEINEAKKAKNKQMTWFYKIPMGHSEKSQAQFPYLTNLSSVTVSPQCVCMSTTTIQLFSVCAGFKVLWQIAHFNNPLSVNCLTCHPIRYLFQWACVCQPSLCRCPLFWWERTKTIFVKFLATPSSIFTIVWWFIYFTVLPRMCT